MPETMAYVDHRLPFLTNEEKRDLMEHILRSMTFTVVCPESPKGYGVTKPRKTAYDYIGYARRFNPEYCSTAEIMKELREGEE